MADEENDVDIFGGLDDDNGEDNIEAHRESRHSVFHFNNNCPSEPFPGEISQSKNQSHPEIKIEKENENANNHHNSYDLGETIRPLNSKDDKKEKGILSKLLRLNQPKENEKKTKEQEKREKKEKKEREEKEKKEKKEREKREKKEKKEREEKEKKEKKEREKKEKENKKDNLNFEQEKWEKTFMNKYISEDKQNYAICLEEAKNEIIISMTNEKENDSPFTSKYELDYLNKKFGKNIHFKSIQEFRHCLKENILKHSLIIKKPYKNAINTVWKLYPKHSKVKKTFTLISSQSWEKNLSLFFYSNFKRAENVVKEIEEQSQMSPSKENKEKVFEERIYNKLIDKMIFLNDKLEKSEAKKKAFKGRIKQNIEENDEKNIKFRNVLIFFDENNLFDTINYLIDKLYMDQIFIIIFSSDSDLKKKIYQIQFNENRKSYFDLNNIFIFKNEDDEYKKIMMTILKIFSYFNQLGDGFFKQLSDLGIKNESLEKEFKYLYNTHYFNILLCGRSGAGKSTFINTIMGEKKSFTLQNKYAGTYRSNYYIHKDYPIKIIDVCGFAEGSEVNENLERLKMIYNENSDNIIIDEYASDSFTFYGDKRNDIHLLLYFNVYNDKYDVVPGELPIIKKAIEKKIPIIFIVNKCEKDFYIDEGLKKDTMKAVKKAREKTIYEKYETYFINCLLKKGFDKLLTCIYEQFKDNIISDDDLSKMKVITTNEEEEKEINKIIEKSKFFGKINSKDGFLNDSLLTSVKDIKNNVVKLAGFYLKELDFFHSFGFYLYKKFYNNILQNPEKNFFPILTDLVKKIYLNFGYKKSNKECNNYILLNLSKYFEIKLDFLENKNREENKANEEEEEDGDDDDDDDDDEEEIIAETPMGDDEENKEFDFIQFKKDYVNLGKLYWFSKMNFKIEQDNAEYILKKNNIQLVDKIFNLEEENNAVKPERLLQIVKSDFGLDNSKNDATNKEKLIVKLFYISYVSNVLISSLCGKMNHKGFKFKSVQNFYYTVSKSYNNAINGFLKIKEQIENEVVEPAHNQAD